MGVIVIGAFIALLVIDAAAFLVLMAAIFVQTAAEILGVDWMDVATAVLCLALAVFFAWFILDCPGCEERKVPHAVEGREEWIDLREGTHYSQGERRTDD